MISVIVVIKVIDTDSIALKMTTLIENDTAENDENPKGRISPKEGKKHSTQAYLGSDELSGNCQWYQIVISPYTLTF